MSSYRKHPALNQSLLKLLLDKTPAHFHHARNNPDESETKCLILGRAIHCLALEGLGEFQRRFAVMPDGITRQSKEGKELYARLSENGRTVLNSSEMDLISNVDDSLHRSESVRMLLEKGEAEKAVFGELEGLECKAQLDWWIPDSKIIVDLKTTEDASPEGFARSCAKYHYDLQAAIYLDITGANYFLFVVVEKTAPYCTAIYEATPEVIENGRAKYRKCFDIYRKCLESNNWHGYTDEIQQLQLPTWSVL